MKAITIEKINVPPYTLSSALHILIASIYAYKNKNKDMKNETNNPIFCSSIIFIPPLLEFYEQRMKSITRILIVELE